MASSLLLDRIIYNVENMETEALKDFYVVTNHVGQ